MPRMDSLMVPSPPQDATRSQPSATALSARRVASPWQEVRAKCTFSTDGFIASRARRTVLSRLLRLRPEVGL